MGTLDAIVGQAIHTNMSQVGHLTFGGEGDAAAEDAAEVLTHINQMTLQSQRTNVAAYMPTDCPTREKHGCESVSPSVLGQCLLTEKALPAAACCLLLHTVTTTTTSVQLVLNLLCMDQGWVMRWTAPNRR